MPEKRMKKHDINQSQPLQENKRRQINQKKKTAVNRFFREIWEKISKCLNFI